MIDDQEVAHSAPRIMPRLSDLSLEESAKSSYTPRLPNLGMLV